MDITLAKTFINIVRADGLSPAAQSLGVSQSTISHRLQSLETELGFPLLERGRGQSGIQLTPAGERFLDYATRWVNLDREINSFKQISYTETLSIGGVESINSFLLSPIFSDFLAENPDYSLRILTHHSWELYDLLNTKNIDIGFVNSKAFYPDIEAELLLKEEYCILHNLDSLKGKEQLTPTELDPKLEIIHSWTPQMEQWHDEWWIPNQEQLYINSNSILPGFFSNHSFWCILPSSNALFYQKNYGLHVARFTNPPVPRDCFIITRRQNSSHLQKKIDRFLQFVRQYSLS